MNEDKLILYYYNDGLTEEQRRDVATALEGDPATWAAVGADAAQAGHGSSSRRSSG